MSDDKKKYPHAGHRKRMRDRLLRCGPRDFHDDELLEMFLFYLIPRRDVSPPARTLVKRFGTLDKVMNADVDQIVETPGIGLKSAKIVHYAPRFFAQHLIATRFDQHPTIGGLRDLFCYMAPLLTGRPRPAMHIVLLNNVNKVVYVRRLRATHFPKPHEWHRLIAPFSCPRFLLVECTLLPSDELFSMRFHAARELAAYMAMSDLEMSDYLIWSYPEENLVSLQDSRVFTGL